MTLARFLRDGHTHHPEKTALIFGENAWTYAEADDINRFIWYFPSRI